MTPTWEGLPYDAVDDSFTRIVRIDFDREQDPAHLHLLLPLDVADRIAGLVDIERHPIPGRADLCGVVMTMGVAADIARAAYRTGLTENDPIRAFRNCIIYILANRWWENGIKEAAGAGLNIDIEPFEGGDDGAR